MSLAKIQIKLKFFLNNNYDKRNNRDQAHNKQIFDKENSFNFIFLRRNIQEYAA
jgi:hypothetical protein